MKISRWYDINWFSVLLTLVIIAFVGGIGTLVVTSVYDQHKLEKTFPVGSSVQLKGLPIKGNVVNYDNGNVTILVIDSYGEGHQITTDRKLLSK